MTPDERQNLVEKLKERQEELRKQFTPQQENEAVKREARKSRLEARKAMDLTDAKVDMLGEVELDDTDQFDKTEKLLAQYQLNLNRFLGKMQNLLVEAIEHIEVLEANFQRLH